MRRKWLLPLVVAAGAFAAFLFAAGYPWQLALLIATAIGALAYSAQSTWARMHRLVRRSVSIEQSPEERE